jgi:hypothetical protein
VFGDGKVNDDTIKFYLVDLVANLEIQLDTCVKFLNLMTVNGGFSGKGFARGLRYLKNYQSAFQNMQVANHLFVVRVAYFLDRVFQDFINNLGNNRMSSNIPGTMAAAKIDLEREQTNLVHTTLGQIKLGGHLRQLREYLPTERDLFNTTDWSIKAVYILETWYMGLNRVRGDLCSIATAIVSIKIVGKKRKRETPWVRVAPLV